MSEKGTICMISNTLFPCLSVRLTVCQAAYYSSSA